MDGNAALWIALGCLAGGAAVNALVGLTGSRLAVRLVVAACIGATLLAGVMARISDGWEALGWFVLSAVFGIPASAGAILGGWLGLRRHARRPGGA